MREYYKKLDKSFFKYGITIPKEYVKEFIFDADIRLGDRVKKKNLDYHV